jgi:hypothetical protein
MKTRILIEGTLGDKFEDFITKVADRRKRSGMDIVVCYNGAYFRVEEKDTLETLNEKYLKALANLETTSDVPTEINEAKSPLKENEWESARITAAVGFVTVAIGRQGFVADENGEISDVITTEAVKYANKLINKLRG